MPVNNKPLGIEQENKTDFLSKYFNNRIAMLLMFGVFLIIGG